MHDKLTKLPVTVLLIHGHVDHAMGAAEFDDIYMNRVDDYIFHEHGRGEFRTEAPAVMQNGVHVTEKDLVPTCRVDALRDLREGNILDLGDVRIEVYECPEYTKGSVVFLIQEERMLPLGDACNNSTFLFDSYSISILEYYRSLNTLLAKLSGKYDTVLMSHDNGMGHPNQIEGVIKACEDIFFRGYR